MKLPSTLFSELHMNANGAAVSALAVHGLVTGALDREQKFRLNRFDLLVPDGQPVRWVLNWRYRCPPRRPRVRPNLTLQGVLPRGGRKTTALFLRWHAADSLGLTAISRTQSSLGFKSREWSPPNFASSRSNEKDELARRVRSSGASILFVGLGCPRQEVFAYEVRGVLSIPVLAVGAAFPFLAGLLPQAPAWMQDAGLEWLFRLACEPRRLWRRYVFLNLAYIFLVTLQALGLYRFPTEGQSPAKELLYG